MISVIEKIILENVDKEHKMIGRDSDGELYLYGICPCKKNLRWYNPLDQNIKSFPYKSLFKMVSWSDELPTLISTLLSDRKGIEAMKNPSGAKR